jgi:MFS family permease
MKPIVTRQVFYGWWITVASGFILFITVGVGLYTLPVFLVPLQNHFGWSRAAIAAGGSVGALTAGLISPMAGAWIDRYGSRKVMTMGALLMGSGFVLLSLMESLWQLYVINLLSAAGLACVAWIPNQTLISNWFVRNRGVAMGISLAGIGLGGLALAPLADLLITRFGWRLAFLALASLIVVPTVGVILVVVRSRPADLGLLPDGDEPVTGMGDPTHMRANDRETDADGMDLGEALRTSAFWILALCNFLSIFASFSIVIHLAAFLNDQGFESDTAAMSLGLVIGMSVGGRVIFGIAADRFTKKNVMFLIQALLALGTLFLFTIQTSETRAGFVIIFGLAYGGAAVLGPLLVGECFGLRSFGKILGLFMLSATIGAATGPVLAGWIYDVTESYRLAFALDVAAFTIASVSITFLRLPKPAR